MKKRPCAANMNPTNPEKHISYDLFITPHISIYDIFEFDPLMLLYSTKTNVHK